MRNLKIQAINIEMTDAIENYFKERMDSLDKFIDPNDESVECSARVSRSSGSSHSGEFYRAEVSIHTSGKNFGAVSEKDNLYAAIDDVKDAVVRKITTHKDKKISLFKKGAMKAKKLLKGF